MGEGMHCLSSCQVSVGSMNEERLERIEAQLKHITEILDEFLPIVRAMLASIPQGPLRWAIKKANKNG